MGRTNPKRKKRKIKPVIPGDHDYGKYPPKYRVSFDQVPYQKVGTSRTVDFLGATRVHIRECNILPDRRFCTFQLTVRAINPQIFPLCIIFRGVPTPGNPKIPKSPKLKKELNHYHPKAFVMFDEIAYLHNEQAQCWFEDTNSRVPQNQLKMIQGDGYKVITRPKFKNQFKRNNWKFVVSPGNCTDASTSVVDEHIGQKLKDKIKAKIQHKRETDPTFNDRLEKEGPSFVRINITHFAVEAYDELCSDDTIPKAFKSCGLCNDKFGRENHLVKCQNLLTYEPPPKEYVRRKSPFSEKEIDAFYDKEIKAITDKRQRKKCERQYARYKKKQKSK